MDDAQRADRGRRAQLAMQEFFAPAFDAVTREYTERAMHIAANEVKPADRIEKLSLALKVAAEVRRQMEALIFDGDHARQTMIRAEKIEALSPAKRRWL